jgi:hypothetical protein
MYEVAGFVILIVVVVALIVTWDRWFGTTLFIVAFLYLIELGSDEKFPIFTYLFEGIKKLQNLQ